MKQCYVILLFAVFLLPGCAKDKVKPSADSLMATEAFSVIDEIKKAYEAKDETALKSHTGALLAESIMEELSFEKAELSFTPRLVRIADKLVKVNLNWRGSWSMRDKVINSGGAADFVFHKETMKLTYIDGDNPFLIPVIKKQE